MCVMGPDKIKLAEIYISFTVVSQTQYLKEKQKHIPHGLNSFNSIVKPLKQEKSIPITDIYVTECECTRHNVEYRKLFC